MATPPPTRQQRDIMDNLSQTLGSFETKSPAPTSAKAAPPPKRKNPRALIVAASRIRIDEDQIRKADKTAESERIQELAASIKELGLQHPPGVRESADGNYEIVYGEGRFIAMTQVLGLDEIEVLRVDASEQDVLWHQLHENVHRTNLHPLDLAEAVRQAQARGYSIGQIAERMKKSETWVQKALTIGAKLSDQARDTLREAEDRPALDTVYAVAQLPQDEQAELADQVVTEKLNRRETEARAEKGKQRRSEQEAPRRSGRKKKTKPYSKTMRSSNGATITIAFRKSEVEDTEVIAALEDVLQTFRPAPRLKAA